MIPMYANQNYLERDQEDADLLVADKIQQTVVADNVISWRYKTLAAFNPYMANDPQALMSMASMNIPDQQLFQQAGEIYGLSTSTMLAQTLPNYTDSYQRAIFNSLSPGQQLSLRQMGYETPKRDVHSNGLFDTLIAGATFPLRGIGNITKPVLGPTFDALIYPVEKTKQLYRTVAQMDDVTRWLALVAGVAATVAVPVTGGTSTPLAAALTSFGVRGLAGMAAYGGTAAISSTIQTGSLHSFAQAWQLAEDGERLFTHSARRKAQELLNDPDLERLAEEIALQTNKPGDLFALAQDIVGVRGGGSQTVQLKQLENVASQYADPGTPRYGEIYNLLSDLLAEPTFVEAMQILERGKISYGRDLVRALNVIPGVDLEADGGAGRWLSGGFDAFMTVWLDPINFLGGAYRGYAFARRGLPSSIGPAIGDKLTEIAQLPEVRRKWQVVVDAVNANDMRLLDRGAREYKPLFVYAQKHARDKGIQAMTVDDFFEFMVGTNQLQMMSKGVGLVPGMKYNQIKGLNRAQSVIANTTGAARDFLRGISDIGLETANFGRLFKALSNHPEAQQQFAEHMSNVDDLFINQLVQEGLDEQTARVVGVLVKNNDLKAVLGVDPDLLITAYDQAIVARAQEFVLSRTSNSRDSYRLGRAIGAAPGGKILRPVASLVDGLTSPIPRGFVRIVGDDMPLDIQKYVELMRHAGVPSYVRDAWTQALIEAPTGGARIVGLTAFLDSVATGSGMRMVKSGNDMLDKYLYRLRQVYSLDEFGRMTLNFDNGPTIPLGTLPDVEMATRWAIPDLHEIRKAVNQSYFMQVAMGLPESQVWRFVQNRIWKPMALLRLGFFFRNMGEEVFATMMRYGVGMWMHERAARQLAQRDTYRGVTSSLKDAALRGINQPLKPHEIYALTARHDLPMSYRGVARVIDRLHGGQIWEQKIYDQLDFVRRMMDRRADRAFTRMEVGIGRGRLPSVSDPLVPLLEVTSRRELFNRNLKKFAFGNDFSYRRMLIGGVDPQLRKTALAFEQTFAKSLMEEIGTSRLAPWELNQQPNIKAIIGGSDINDEDVFLVQTTSERLLTTRDNSIPEAQPYWNAVLSNTEQVFDDKIIGSGYGPLLRWAPMEREVLEDLLRPFAELFELDAKRLSLLQDSQLDAMRKSGQRTTPNLIDRDLLQLFTEVEAGYFDKGRFNATLRRIRVTDEKMAELSKLPPRKIVVDGETILEDHPLYAWAQRRNELVDKMQVAFPGDIKPEWWEIDTLFREMLPDGGDFWIPQGHKEYEIWKDFVTHTDAEKRLVLELAALENASRVLADQSPAVREYVRALLDHWQTDPYMLSSRGILNGASSPSRKPSMMVYRGISNDSGAFVDDQGNLVLAMRPQIHWDVNNAVSFTFSEPQAELYARENVNAWMLPPETNRGSFVFSVRLDDLMESVGVDARDLTVGAFDAVQMDNLVKSRSQEYVVARMQAPGLPWTEGKNNWMSAEIAIGAGTSSGTNQVVIPAGKWSAKRISAATPGKGGDTGLDLVNDWTQSVELNTRNLDAWPFFETQTDVEDAIRMELWANIGAQEVQERLQLNPRWYGIGNGDTFYVLDTRNAQYARTSDDRLVRLNLAKTEALGTKVQPDVVALNDNPLATAIVRQTPLVVKTREEALMVQQLAAPYVKSPLPILTMDIPQASPAAAELVPYVFDVNPVAGSGETIQLYGWNIEGGPLPGVVDQTLYEDFPAIWSYLDEVSSETPVPVLDAAIKELFNRVLAKRRTRLEFIGSSNAPDVWRNVGGVAVKLEPGDLLQLDDELYLTASFDPASKVSATDQRVSRSYVQEYGDDSEVMWSIVAPVLLDRNQAATGRMLVEPKVPLQVPGRNGRIIEVPQIERRLRAATKRNVENTPAGDLPDLEIAQRYKPYKANVVGSKVDKLFELMGKGIDAISRKPLAFHAFNIAYERNRGLQRWLLNQSDDFKTLSALIPPHPHKPIQGSLDLARAFAIAEHANPIEVLDWSERQLFAYLKGMTPNEIDLAAKVISNPDTTQRVLSRFKTSRLFPDQFNFYVEQVIDRAKNIVTRHDAIVSGPFGEYVHTQAYKQLLIENEDDLLDLFEELYPNFMSDNPFEFLPNQLTPEQVLQRNALRERIQARAYVIDSEFPTTSRNKLEAALLSSTRRRANIDETAMKYASEHAIRDVMPFVDSHEIRSQFAEFTRGFLPFWYAEENFIKRWAKILGEGGPLATAQRLERLQLTYMGLQSAGIVRTDQQGNDYFVYPGSEYLVKAVDLAFAITPGSPFAARAHPELEVLFQSPTDMILPGFRAEFGQPSVTPLITAPMSLISAAVPWLKPLDKALIGEEYVHRNLIDRIIPASVARVYYAIDDVFDNDGLNPKNERTAAALIAGMAHLQASGNGLDENSTIEERDEFIRRAREHAKIIIVSQALAGYLLPGPPGALQLLNGTSFDWITNGEITNPADLLAAEYYELIQNLGIEEGTIKWLELNPAGRLKDVLNPLAYTISKSYSASGAPLPSTEEGIEFYENNRDSFDAFPTAAAWLLPQDESDARTQTAYTAEQILGLREKRAPDEFVDAMLYREGAVEYFASQDAYNQRYAELKEAGRDTEAKSLKLSWSDWSAAFKATHPIFAQQLESGAARERRKVTIQQMRVALDDPEFPRAPHFESLKTLQDSFDAYMVARGRLALDRTAGGQARSASLRLAFDTWATNFVALNPAVNSYWLTVLRPESGLD